MSSVVNGVLSILGKFNCCLELDEDLLEEIQILFGSNPLSSSSSKCLKVIVFLKSGCNNSILLRRFYPLSRIALMLLVKL
jgi:hypothetical protein